MLKKHFKKQSVIIFSVGVLALILLISLMNSFSPDQFVPVGTLIIFFLIYLVCYAVFYATYGILLGVASVVNLKKNSVIGYKKLVYLAIVSVAPVVLLALQSIHGVGAVEFVLILLATLLVCFYVSRQ